MEPTKAMADEIYRQRILRARQMTPDERIREGFRLFEEECERMRESIRGEHPDADARQVEEILTERLEVQRRVEESGRYVDIIVVPGPDGREARSHHPTS